MSSISATVFMPFTFPFIRLWMKVLLLLFSVSGVFNIYHALLFIRSTESSKHIFIYVRVQFSKSKNNLMLFSINLLSEHCKKIKYKI